MNIKDKAKFLDRCTTNPNYDITFYVQDSKTANDIFNQLSDYYNGSGVIKEVSLTDNIKIEFYNGSTIRIVSKEHMIPGIWSHIIFMDSRIRETYIKDEIRPTIDQYITGEDSAMLNPKPIYLKFEDGGN